MLALLIIAIILAVMIFLSLIPIRLNLYFRYNNGATHSLSLRYGFIRINLPRGDKKKEEKPQLNEAEAKPKEKRNQAAPKPGEIIAFVFDNRAAIKKMIYSVLGYMFKRAIKINKLKIKLVTGVEDAMQTALIFGAESAFIFNTIGALDKLMRIDKHSIDLKPAFNNPHIFAETEDELSTNIFNVLAIAVIALRHAIPLYFRFRKEFKNGKSN